MECPFCNHELNGGDAWGYLASHQSGEVLGHTFTCPNSDGFESEEEAMEYLDNSGQTIESMEIKTWEEVSCDSSFHSVSGAFYTDKQGNLHNGYPC